MGGRTRYWLICVLLVATTVLCVTVQVREMRQDLLGRTQEALAAAGVPFYGVELAGRDAVLHGIVPSPERATEIARIVGSVVGVRHVRDALVVERIAPAAPVSRQQQPSLRLQRLGDRLFIAGRLPDDGSAAQLLGAAQAEFGATKVTSDLRSSAAIGAPEWLAASGNIVGLMGAAQGNGRLSIAGSTALLFGLVGNRAERQRLIDAAAEIDSLEWRFDLVALDGATTDTGAAP